MYSLNLHPFQQAIPIYTGLFEHILSPIPNIPYSDSGPNKDIAIRCVASTSLDVSTAILLGAHTGTLVSRIGLPAPTQTVLALYVRRAREAQLQYLGEKGHAPTTGQESFRMGTIHAPAACDGPPILIVLSTA